MSPILSTAMAESRASDSLSVLLLERCLFQNTYRRLGDTAVRRIITLLKATIAIPLVFHTCPIVAAAEHKEVDPIGGDANAAPSNPNNLEPIPAYDSTGYNQAVFRSLLGEEPGELWMVGKPSFSPEYAVILRHEVKYSDHPADEHVKADKWVIEFAGAKKQIWRWKDLGGGRMKVDIQITKEVTRNRAEVTREFAQTICKAWEAVLKQTRYSDADYHGHDGETYQFCYFNLFGEVWTPQDGIPKMITELGHMLGDLAKADHEAREDLVTECVTLAKKITIKAGKLKQGSEHQSPAGGESK